MSGRSTISSSKAMNLRQMVSARLEPLEKDPIYQIPYRVSMFYRRRSDEEPEIHENEQITQQTETDLDEDTIQVPEDHITQTYYQAYERANERIRIISKGVHDLTDKDTFDRARKEYLAFKRTKLPNDKSSSKLKVSRYPKALLSQDLLQQVYFINAYQKINQIIKSNERHRHPGKPYKNYSYRTTNGNRFKDTQETIPTYDYKARLFEVKNKCIQCNSLKCRCTDYENDACIYAAQTKTDSLYKRYEELSSQIKHFSRPISTVNKSVPHKKVRTKDKTPHFQRETRKRNPGILNFSTDFILGSMFDKFNSSYNDTHNSRMKAKSQIKKINSPKECVFPVSEARKSTGSIPKYKKPRIKQSTKLFKQQEAEVDISGVNESGLYISQASFERVSKSRHSMNQPYKARSSSPSFSIKIDMDKLYSPEDNSEDSEDEDF